MPFSTLSRQANTVAVPHCHRIDTKAVVVNQQGMLLALLWYAGLKVCVQIAWAVCQALAEVFFHHRSLLM